MFKAVAQQETAMSQREAVVRSTWEMRGATRDRRRGKCLLFARTRGVLLEFPRDDRRLESDSYNLAAYPTHTTDDHRAGVVQIVLMHC